jgi:predicted MPP superfamily phosphohydrolase
MLGVAGVLYGTHVERHRLRVSRLEVEVQNLPEPFDGYTIVQLSDFHIGGRGWSQETLRRAVDLAMAQHGDLIALTGDYVETTAGIADCTEAFASLRAPDGVLAVLGNHDYHDRAVRAQALVAALEGLGIRVLRNQSFRIRREQATLWVVGVDDPHSGHDYLPAAMAGVPSEARPVMLVHYPDFAWRLPPDRWALVLSGHAHGSQIRLPLIGRYARHHVASTRFSHGLYRINRTPVFVTTGVGTSGRPIRLLARPEVAVIRLRSAPALGA